MQYASGASAVLGAASSSFRHYRRQDRHHIYQHRQPPNLYVQAGGESIRMLRSSVFIVSPPDGAGPGPSVIGLIGQANKVTLSTRRSWEVGQRRRTQCPTAAVDNTDRELGCRTSGPRACPRQGWSVLGVGSSNPSTDHPCRGTSTAVPTSWPQLPGHCCRTSGCWHRGFAGPWPARAEYDFIELGQSGLYGRPRASAVWGRHNRTPTLQRPIAHGRL